MNWEHSIKSHKEKREHSEEHKGTNDAPLEQHNGEDMKDNLTSFMLVVCPNHSSVKKYAHKTC